MKHLLNHNNLKQETNLKENTQKHSNTWRLSNILLNNVCVNHKIKGEIKKYLKTNENEHTTAQNLWDTGIVVPRGKFIAIQGYLKNIEKSQRPGKMAEE